MATDINLKWEWPAGRKADQKLIVNIASITKHNTGFFGLKKSPSLIEGIPDPIDIKGIIIGGDSYLGNKSITITLPKVELENVSEGNLIAIGVIEPNICICLKTATSATEDLSQWNCES